MFYVNIRIVCPMYPYCGETEDKNMCTENNFYFDITNNFPKKLKDYQLFNKINFFLVNLLVFQLFKYEQNLSEITPLSPNNQSLKQSKI